MPVGPQSSGRHVPAIPIQSLDAFGSDQDAKTNEKCTGVISLTPICVVAPAPAALSNPKRLTAHFRIMGELSLNPSDDPEYHFWNGVATVGIGIHMECDNISILASPSRQIVIPPLNGRISRVVPEVGGRLGSQN